MFFSYVAKIRNKSYTKTNIVDFYQKYYTMLIGSLDYKEKDFSLFCTIYKYDKIQKNAATRRFNHEAASSIKLKRIIIEFYSNILS